MLIAIMSIICVWFFVNAPEPTERISEQKVENIEKQDPILNNLFSQTQPIPASEPEKQTPQTQATQTPSTQTQPQSTQKPQSVRIQDEDPPTRVEYQPQFVIQRPSTSYSTPTPFSTSNPTQRYYSYNGTQCIDTTRRGKECFILQGVPSAYRWNSYTKGTPLGGGGVADKDHRAIDIYTTKGVKVYALWDGYVLTAQNLVGDGCGQTVTIQHAQFNFVTTSCHLNSITVRAGTHIKAGDQIGTVGSSGSTPDNHLHFRIYDTTKPSAPYPNHGWPLDEYSIIAFDAFRGIHKGKFHGEAYNI